MVQCSPFEKIKKGKKKVSTQKLSGRCELMKVPNVSGNKSSVSIENGMYFNMGPF